MMMENPGQSIPKQAGNWTDVIGAYRFLSNPDVDAQQIQAPHRNLTRDACADHKVVLAITDISELDYTSHPSTIGLGKLGSGTTRGLQQISTLAVTTNGSLLGMLRQHWYTRPESPEDETRRQRQSRWCEPNVWHEAVRALADFGRGHSAGCRCIHVFDRGGDCYSALAACCEQNQGFLIRARHDRLLIDEYSDRLWTHMAAQPVVCIKSVKVSAHRSPMKKERRIAREAAVSVRFDTVTFGPPINDPRSKGVPPVSAHVVYACEDTPPTEDSTEPIDWMLLTSERVETAPDALRVIEWYAHRWLIEEFHRVEKEGCRLEDAQLDDAEDIKRLAAITGVVAVRMLQLRDLAESTIAPAHEEGPRLAPADDPAALKNFAPSSWIRVVAAIAKVNPHTLTPRQFWLGIARRGGWLGRKSDGRPGWKTVWRGWYDIQLMVVGLEIRDSS